MTHVVKLDSKILERVKNALEAAADRIDQDPDGFRAMAVVEYGTSHVQHPGVAGQDDKADAVYLRVTGLEFAHSREHETVLRDVQAALYKARTSAGTLMEGSPEDNVLRHGAGLLGADPSGK